MPRSKSKQIRVQTSPQDSTVLSGLDAKPSDSLMALCALYQGEKTDMASILSSAMAMMGLGLAYMAGSLVFLNSSSRGHPSYLVAVLIPLPLWLVVAYHSLVTLNAMGHSLSVTIIEDALFRDSGLQVPREWIGTAASDEIMDINKQGVVHKIATYVVYGGVLVLAVGFTIFALWFAIDTSWGDDSVLHKCVFTTALVGYLLLGAESIASWIVGIQKIGASRNEYKRHSKS